MVRDAVALFASEHEAPASVIVTVEADPTAVAVQLLNPTPSVIVGFAGTVNELSKKTVIVSPAVSAPTAVALNPTVQFEFTPALMTVPLNVTLVTEPAAMTMFDAGEAGAVS